MGCVHIHQKILAIEGWGQSNLYSKHYEKYLKNYSKVWED
jgi:hypothetical protein